MTYPEVFNMLTSQVCFIVFIKRDNSWRFMLGTRNMQAIWSMYPENKYPLDLHDAKCNINNGAMSVFDLEKGDGRSFKMERLLGIHGVPAQQFIDNPDECFKQFDVIKEAYLKVMNDIESGEQTMFQPS